MKITLPEVDGRYMSLLSVSQDHYMIAESKPGTYELTKDTVGTRFSMVTVRTFYNASDPDDLAKAHAAQDKITVSGGGKGPFEAPNWDTDQLKVAPRRPAISPPLASTAPMRLVARKKSVRSTIWSAPPLAGVACHALPLSTL